MVRPFAKPMHISRGGNNKNLHVQIGVIEEYSILYLKSYISHKTTNTIPTLIISQFFLIT